MLHFYRITIFLCFILFLIVGWVTLSQEEDLIWQKEVIEKVGFDTWDNPMDRVQKIANYFCNNWFQKIEDLEKNLEINIEAGEEQELCLLFANKNQQEVNIILWFPDWRKKYKTWAIVCDINLTGESVISNLFIKPKKSDFIFSLKPDEQVIKKFTLRIPKNKTGSIIWCASFKIENDIQKAKTWNMFNIEVVKKATIEINITWSKINNYQRLDDTKYLIKDNKQLILKIITWIILLRLIISIIEQIKKKKHHKNKK